MLIMKTYFSGHVLPTIRCRHQILIDTSVIKFWESWGPAEVKDAVTAHSLTLITLIWPNNTNGISLLATNTYKNIFLATGLKAPHRVVFCKVSLAPCHCYKSCTNGHDVGGRTFQFNSERAVLEKLYLFRFCK